MSDFNPYQAPGSDVTATNDPLSHLASRGQRFAAAVIDGIISLVLVIPLMYLMGFFSYMEQGLEPPFVLTLLGTIAGFIIFIAVHYVLLNRYGQTVGKKLLNIRIADMDGRKADVKTILLKRYLPISVVGLIPVVGQILPMVDILLIFRKDRRCAHDLIAGTQVLRVTAK